MLQGDALAVQLFIGAAAISALTVAMTQAGWTHRWFVGGMFGLGALLAMASVGWRYIETRLPLINDALQTVAQSRAAWFLSGVVPALIAGMLINDLLRLRRESHVKVPPGWLPLFLAEDTFARQDLRDRHAYVRKQISDVSVQCETLVAEIAQLQTAIIAVDEATRSQMAKALVRLTEQHRENRESSQKLIWTKVDCSEALRMNIYAQLQDGKLIAKGFLAPHTPGSSERIIPTEEWRFLNLDDQADKALGPNFEYIALLIGKPDR
jgi:hypothetical protein